MHLSRSERNPGASEPLLKVGHREYGFGRMLQISCGTKEEQNVTLLLIFRPGRLCLYSIFYGRFFLTLAVCLS